MAKYYYLDSDEMYKDRINHTIKREYIDRHTAIDTACTCHGGVHCNHYPCNDIRAIMDIPVADVAPIVHGKWLDHQIGQWIYAKCSECNTVHDVRSKYCPECGARMVMG